MTQTPEFMKREMAGQALTLAIHLACEAGLEPAIINQLLALKLEIAKAERQAA